MAVAVPPKELLSPPIVFNVALPVTTKMKMVRNPITRSIPISLKKSKWRSHRAMVREECASDAGDWKALEEIRTALCRSVEGINRGIFGVPSAKKVEIEGLVKLLESQNPTPYPTQDLHKVDGCWRLIYGTITILGAKRTKLGLRDFISLGDFLQTIDIAKRVDIEYQNSTIAPEELMNIFRKNYDVLLSIFNPEGWLEITYVDETLRIGRDDKGNIFVLERS